VSCTEYKLPILLDLNFLWSYPWYWMGSQQRTIKWMSRQIFHYWTDCSAKYTTEFQPVGQPGNASCDLQWIFSA